MKTRRKIFFAINGYGFGNSIRCINIIQQYADDSQNLCSIISSGNSYHFLKRKFPHLEIIEIPQLSYHPIQIFKHAFAFHKVLLQERPEILILDSMYPLLKPFKTKIYQIRSKVHFNKIPNIFELKSFFTEVIELVYTKFSRFKLIEAGFGDQSYVRQELIQHKQDTHSDQYAILVSSGSFPLPPMVKEKMSQLMPIKEYHLSGSTTEMQEQYLKDLSNAEIVVCRGGYSILNEVKFLNKKAFILPIENHYEQQTNAIFFEKNGWGQILDIDNLSY